AGRGARRRRGVTAFLSLFMLLMFFVVAGFTVDLNFAIKTGVELQTMVDAAAIAGASQLVSGTAATAAEVRDIAGQNWVCGRPLTADELDIRYGEWDRQQRSFTEVGGALDVASAVRVIGTRGRAPLFFGRLMGFESFSVTRSAVATFQPRDIMIVVDYSGSMNDDSELRHISRLGRTAIENNLRLIYEELGSPRYGDMTWTPRYLSSSYNSTVLYQLGLNGVPYPYPRGSWYEYFDYVREDADVYNAGYRRRYGYLTLVNYWLDLRPMAHETPDLWMTSEQPLRALKNAVALFLQFVNQPDTDDRVGLVAYTSADGTALLEHPLTRDLEVIGTISNQRQAGHYHTYTNIGDGIRVAREALVSSARPGTARLMVLVTDGLANRPSNTNPTWYAEYQARLTAQHKIPILTISLGADADRDLMRDIAEETDGVHFNIPGGQTVAAYEQDLIEVFREIAFHRPLKLVQ
ncbi:MAG: VWA domain-containing protein, partial [Pirellulaceae bacterium]|nr:VWA domain-containing protein [Pirellulaceae bacterium]